MIYYKDTFGNFIIKLSNYDTFLQYKVLFNYLNFTTSYNNSTLQILLNINEIAIIQEVHDRVKMYTMLDMFDASLHELNYKISDYSGNTLIIKNIMLHNYIILGLNFRLQSEPNNKKMYEYIFGLSPNAARTYLIYTNHATKNDIISLEDYQYNHYVSIINYGDYFSDTTAMCNIIPEGGNFLNVILGSIYSNLNEITKTDYTVIFNKNGINHNIFNTHMMDSIGDYIIIGNLIQDSIMKYPKYIKTITELKTIDDVYIKKTIFNKIYSDFKYIIFNSSFLTKIIGDIKDEPIDILSIKCAMMSET